jgi:hypothetical protein
MSTTVWAYVDICMQVGDLDLPKLFASQEPADEWFAENDPEGGAFEYPMLNGVCSAHQISR